MSTSFATQNTEYQNPFSRRFVTPLFMGSALNPINSSLIATALVPIAAAVNVPIGQTALLVSVLYITTAIAQPTFGKLSDHFGPRRMFMIGTLTVLVGGLIGGMGQNLSTLMLSRILIGAGTSSAYPSAMLIVRRRATEMGLKEPPGNVLGGLVIAAMVTITVGLPIGGVLVEYLGWRTIFLINIPFGLITLLMALMWIPHDPPVRKTRSIGELVERIDLPGAASFSAMLTGLMVFIFSLPHLNWVSLIIGVVSAMALTVRELGAAIPFIDLRFLASNLSLTRTYIRFSLATLCAYTVLYGLTQWLEAGRGFNAEEAGLLILPMNAVSAIIARTVSSRNLVRLPLITAAATSLAGSIGMLLLQSGTSLLWIIMITILFGIMLGSTSTGNQTTLYTEVTSDQIASASGLFRTFGYIGSISSSAIIAVMFSVNVTNQGLHSISMALIVVSIIGLVIVLTDRKVMGMVRAPRVS